MLMHGSQHTYIFITTFVYVVCRTIWFQPAGFCGPLVSVHTLTWIKCCIYRMPKYSSPLHPYVFMLVHPWNYTQFINVKRMAECEQRWRGASPHTAVIPADAAYKEVWSTQWSTSFQSDIYQTLLENKHAAYRILEMLDENSYEFIVLYAHFKARWNENCI